MTTLVIACGTGNANKETSPAEPGASPAASPAAGDKSASVDDLKAVLAAHDKALSDKSLDAVMGTFSTDPKTVVLGTGAEEKWVGPDAIKGAYTEMFKDYDPGTLTTNCDWKEGGTDADGNLAWMAAICSCKDSLAGKSREYKLNVSAAMTKQDGKWRFIMLHMSNAFQPPVTK
jgi:ketosteroid isomerase-like protein